MSIELLKKLPTPTEIKADYPVTQKVARIKEERDEMIRRIVHNILCHKKLIKRSVIKFVSILY